MRPWGVETQVRPPKWPRTFTISWTEQSNMSSWWTYSDDAAWLTAGDGAFDDFFWYSAVLLNTSGVETAEMTQSWWVFTGVMSTLGNITSGDNVMIKFPVRWIKMSKSGSIVTLSITEELGKEWYQYYAFQNTGTINTNDETTPTHTLYLWAYLSSKSSNISKSWSWKTIWNYTIWDEISYSSANGSWWSIYGWYQRMLINAYYMMKYWNPNAQSVIWMWVSGTTVSTWWTDNQTNATYWNTGNMTTQMKIFGLEDRYWNYWTWVWWLIMNGTSDTQMDVALHSFSTSISWTFMTIWSPTSNADLSSILWTNKWMFFANSTSWTDYTQYYCDAVASYRWCYWQAWWSWWSYGVLTGMFRLWFFYGSTTAVNTSRLMYL